MNKHHVVGQKELFAIGFTFFEETRDTELEIFIGGNNVLAYKKGDKRLTTRWCLDDIAFWLRDFIDNLAEDDFPFECEGSNAAEKDAHAREFDSDDDEEFDLYYQKLYDWNQRHSWHSRSNGAILANLYFQLIEGKVEVSWNNDASEEGVAFEFPIGSERIDRNVFVDIVNKFLYEYAIHLF